MSESVGSGDGYLAIEDSSFEEDWQFIIRIQNNNNDGSDKKKRRRGGGSKKGKSKNKNRNRRLGHTILIKVRCSTQQAKWHDLSQRKQVMPQTTL
jgi:hypothetical protein